MEDLKKEGLKYIEEGFKKIEKYRKNNEIDITFNVMYRIEGGIDMLYKLEIIDIDESLLLQEKSLNLACTMEREDYEYEISL